MDSANVPGTYDDSDFADLVTQKFGEVSEAHLTVEFEESAWEWNVYNNHIQYGVSDQDLVAIFFDEDLAYWFVQAHSNQPRVNDLIRSSMDEAERADRERDELIRTIVNGSKS